MGDILILANRGPPGKWPLKQREGVGYFASNKPFNSGAGSAHKTDTGLFNRIFAIAA